MQASETSTCALHPGRRVAKLTREADTLLVVDGITAVGVLDLPMDQLGIDVLVTGSQKALMLPPGLAFVALSRARLGRDRARRSCRASTSTSSASRKASPRSRRRGRRRSR